MSKKGFACSTSAGRLRPEMLRSAPISRIGSSVVLYRKIYNPFLVESLKIGYLNFSPITEDVLQRRRRRRVEVIDPSVDTDLLSRKVCVSKAHYLLAQIFGNDQLKQLLRVAAGDHDFDTLLAMKELIASFEDEMESMESLLKLSPNP